MGVGQAVHHGRQEVEGQVVGPAEAFHRVVVEAGRAERDVLESLRQHGHDHLADPEDEVGPLSTHRAGRIHEEEDVGVLDTVDDAYREALSGRPEIADHDRIGRADGGLGVARYGLRGLLDQIGGAVIVGVGIVGAALPFVLGAVQEAVAIAVAVQPVREPVAVLVGAGADEASEMLELVVDTIAVGVVIVVVRDSIAVHVAGGGRRLVHRFASRSRVRAAEGTGHGRAFFVAAAGPEAEHHDEQSRSHPFDHNAFHSRNWSVASTRARVMPGSIAECPAS